MSYFSNKVVLVTGGSDGIGKSLVEQLLQQGAKVATCGRNHDKLYRLQRENANYPLHVVAADVSKETDCKSFVASSLEAFGRIDILINNAGMSMRALLTDLDVETLRRLMDVNFWGTVYCTRLVMNEVMRSQGTIVGILSVAAFRGLPGRTGYSASKFAVNGFLEALRTEVMKDGVNVMWVYPGFVASNIRHAALNENAQAQGSSTMDEESMMTPDECARHILRAIRKRKRSLLLTSLAWRTRFINRFFPSLADRLIRKFYFKNGQLVK
jgi:short-subunit dehydrogenase